MAKSCITVSFTYSSRMAIFLNTGISQGSAATRLGCGGVYIHHFVTNFLLSLTVKEFWKSVNIWWSYGQELGVLFFLTHSVDGKVAFIRSPVVYEERTRPAHRCGYSALLLSLLWHCWLNDSIEQLAQNTYPQKVSFNTNGVKKPRQSRQNQVHLENTIKNGCR